MTNQIFAAVADDIIFAIGATEQEAIATAESDGVTRLIAYRMSPAVAESVERDGFDTEDVVAGDAVTEAVRASRIGSDIASEGANGATGRVGWVEQSVGFEFGVEVIEGDPCFDFAPEPLRVDAEDVVER